MNNRFIGKGKGPDGLTIREAIKQVIERLGMATCDTIFTEVRNIYAWKDNTIWRLIMGCTINLQPGYREWPSILEKDKCLFIANDGFFERYDKNKHGIFKDGIRVP